MIGEHWEIRTKMLFVSILDLKKTEPYYGKCLICNGEIHSLSKEGIWPHKVSNSVGQKCQWT